MEKAIDNRYNIKKLYPNCHKLCIKRHLVSFDNELLKLLVSAYKAAGNNQKREVYQTLSGITFDYNYVSSDQDVLETVNNLRSFVTALSEMLTIEKDSFAKYIINETISHVYEMVNKIAEENGIAT